MLWTEVREEWNEVSCDSHVLLGSSDWKLYYNEKGTPFYYNTRTGDTSYNIQPDSSKNDSYSSQTTLLGMKSLILFIFYSFFLISIVRTSFWMGTSKRS